MKFRIIAAFLHAAVLSSATAGPTAEELAERVAKLERAVEELSKLRDFLVAGTRMKVAVPAKPGDGPQAEDEIVINVKADGGIVAEALLDSTLKSKFFGTTEPRRHPWIVEHSDGSVEDTSDGKVDADDLLFVERTANCSSTHQGEHAMDFCDAAKSADGLELEFWGGLPAYTGVLTVRVNAKHQFFCEFKADYVSPPNPLRWVIRKKTMKLKDAIGEPGSRLRGWISVEFEEIDVNSGSAKSYKIEGYFKPVILNAPGTDPEKDE